MRGLRTIKETGVHLHMPPTARKVIGLVTNSQKQAGEPLRTADYIPSCAQQMDPGSGGEPRFPPWLGSEAGSPREKWGERVGRMEEVREGRNS